MKNKKVLFATTTPAKVKKYKEALEEKGIELITIKDIEIKLDHFYFTDKPCEKRNEGYPLDSISIVPEFNKYLVELTEEDKKEYKKKDKIDNVVEFIVNNV